MTLINTTIQLNKQSSESNQSTNFLLTAHLFALAKQEVPFYFHILREVEEVESNMDNPKISEITTIQLYSESYLDLTLHEIIPNSRLSECPIQDENDKQTSIHYIFSLFKRDQIEQKNLETQQALSEYQLDHSLYPDPFAEKEQPILSRPINCFKQTDYEVPLFDNTHLVNFAQEKTLEKIFNTQFSTTQSYINFLIQKISTKTDDPIDKRNPLLSRLIKAYQTNTLISIKPEHLPLSEIMANIRDTDHLNEATLFNLLISELKDTHYQIHTAQSPVIHFSVIDLFNEFTTIIENTIQDFSKWSVKHLPEERPEPYLWRSDLNCQSNIQTETQLQKQQTTFIQEYNEIKLKLHSFIQRSKKEHINSLEYNEWIILLMDIKQYLQVNELFFLSEEELHKKYPTLDWNIIVMQIISKYSPLQAIKNTPLSQSIVKQVKKGFILSNKNPYTSLTLKHFLTNYSDAYRCILTNTTRSEYVFQKRLPHLSSGYDHINHSVIEELTQDWETKECPFAHLNTFEALNAIDLILFQFSSLTPIGQLPTCFQFHDGNWRDIYFFRHHDLFHRVCYGSAKIQSTFQQYFYLQLSLAITSAIKNYSPQEQAYLTIALFINHETMINTLSIDDPEYLFFSINHIIDNTNNSLHMIQDLLKSLDIGFICPYTSKSFDGKYSLELLYDSIKDIFTKEQHKAVIQFLIACS